MNQTSPEKYPSQSGNTVLMLHIALVIVATLFFAYSDQAPFGLLLLVVAGAMVRGYFVVKPQQGRYVTFFGEYKGYIDSQGLHWVNPLLQTAAFSKDLRHCAFKDKHFCDLHGTSLQVSATVSWHVGNYQQAFIHADSIEAQVLHYTEASWAHVLGKFPYQGKDTSLQGNKQLLERELWRHLQERFNDLGLQVAGVSLIYLTADDEGYSQATQQKRQLALEAQAQKNWALQAPSMAAHIVKQLKELPQVNATNVQQEQALLEKVLVALIKKDK